MGTAAAGRGLTDELATCTDAFKLASPPGRSADLQKEGAYRQFPMEHTAVRESVTRDVRLGSPARR